MDLRQIETFYWAAHLGGFTAAAQRLHTTQPAVSARIRQLETSLGVNLFDGHTRSMRLTAAGRALVPYAVQILTLATDIRGAVGDPAAAFKGTVRLGAADITALSWFPELITKIGDLYPGLSVELNVDLSVNLRRGLERHELDIAVLVLPQASPSLVVEHLGMVEMAWVAHPKWIGRHSHVSTMDIARMPIISHLPGSDLHTKMQAWFAQGGVEPPAFHGCNSLATLIRLISQGVGISVTPPALIAEEIERGELMRLDVDRPFEALDFVAAYPIDTFVPAAPRIGELAREVAQGSPAFH